MLGLLLFAGLLTAPQQLPPPHPPQVQPPQVQSSTFDNTRVSVAAAPALEFNFFPYSAYQRRQLRAQYSAGVQQQTYHEETLFGKLEETLPNHEFSVTYDQRERWGAVEGEIEWFQYLHDLSKSRLEADGDISWRILRGLSISANANASRIHDQLSLRRRGATQEEILLRLRELQSDYEYGFSLSLTYTFGSIFSSIVNPRFGQITTVLGATCSVLGARCLVVGAWELGVGNSRGRAIERQHANHTPSTSSGTVADDT